jgi:hypothetical protein
MVTWLTADSDSDVGNNDSASENSYGGDGGEPSEEASSLYDPAWAPHGSKIVCVILRLVSRSGKL